MDSLERYGKVIFDFKKELRIVANESNPMLLPLWGSGLSFVCPIDIECNISLEDATHPIEKSYIPSQETQKGGITSLICRHCWECGF